MRVKSPEPPIPFIIFVPLIWVEFTFPSVAKEGKISTIVPMVSHHDHTEHDVNIVITEQGVADLRGKSPKERAQAIIENCAHPDYKELLWDYLKLAGNRAQTPHAIQAALGMHAELAKSGDMKNTNWAEYSKKYNIYSIEFTVFDSKQV